MTVTAYPKDVDGANLSAKVTAAQTAYNNISSTSVAVKAAAAAALNQAQVELVLHYLDVGRITAATILSTLS